MWVFYGSEVLTVQVDVDTVQSDQEVGKDILLGRRDMGEEGADEGLSRGELLVDLDQEFESLGIDISDIDTTLVREENVVALPDRVNAHVIFRVGRVGKERLDDELVQAASGTLNLCKVVGRVTTLAAVRTCVVVRARQDPQ